MTDIPHITHRAPWHGTVRVQEESNGRITLYDDEDDVIAEEVDAEWAPYLMAALNSYDDLRDLLSAARATLLLSDHPRYPVGKEDRQEMIERISRVLSAKETA